MSDRDIHPEMQWMRDALAVVEAAKAMRRGEAGSIKALYEAVDALLALEARA